MLPLYRDPHFLFRFEEPRIISRVHLEGVEAGRPVRLVRVDPVSLSERDIIAEATVGPEGWVELAAPFRLLPGDAFLAIPASIE
jgi:hypothetical protein